MTKALLEWETIDSDQIDDIINGLPPRPPKEPGNNKPSTPSGTSGTQVQPTPSDVPEAPAA